MEINQKFFSFCGKVLDKIYSEQLLIRGVVYNTDPNFSIALFSTANEEFH